MAARKTREQSQVVEKNLQVMTPLNAVLTIGYIGTIGIEMYQVHIRSAHEGCGYN